MRSAIAVALTLTLAAGIAPLAGCSRAPPDSTPEGAVKLFLDDMEAASDDPRVMKKAFDLLGPAAKANLEQRAHHTSLLQGRQVVPWEMLAAGRFGLSFRPKTLAPADRGRRPGYRRGPRLGPGDRARDRRLRARAGRLANRAGAARALTFPAPWIGTSTTEGR